MEKHVQNEEVLLANYTDGLSDVNLEAVVEKFLQTQSLACFVSVQPKASFHMITADEGGIVKSIEPITKSGARMNGGFFVLGREIFQHLREGEELVEEPFRRLIAAGQLLSYTHHGFWACMDTFKEMQQLEDLHGRGNAPWMVWNRHAATESIAREAVSRLGANGTPAMSVRA